MLKFKLIIGLGNPNVEYEKTYHNVGHLFVNFIENSKFEIRNSKLLKSNVFMNKSGGFVRQALAEKKVMPADLLIIHDDADIEFGKFKFSFARNSAGHKGVQSIINQLKTNKFWRLRIGIRPKTAVGKNRTPADKLVLKKITPERMKTLMSVFKEAARQLI